MDVDVDDYENEMEPDEYERLLAYLRLSPVRTVLSCATIDDPFLSRLVTGWCHHISQYDPTHFKDAEVDLDGGEYIVISEGIRTTTSPPAMGAIAGTTGTARPIWAMLHPSLLPMDDLDDDRNRLVSLNALGILSSLLCRID